MITRETVAAFAETWSELAASLADEYGCHMTCAEADALAALFRSAGHHETADIIIERHAALEEEPEACTHQA